MASFQFTARDPQGAIVSDMITAESERAVLDILDRRGLFPVRIEEKSVGRGMDFSKRAFAGRVRSDELVAFARQLADLLKVGITLNRALDTLARQAPNTELGRIVDNLRADVSSGTPLSDALGKFPRIFSGLFISMIQAGEVGGFLEDSLERVATFQEKSQELISRVKAAMAYPVLLAVMGTATVIFLLVFFIPKFTTIFADMGGVLPWPTLVLIGLSDFLQEYGLFLVVGLTVATFLLFRALATDSGRLTFDRLRLRVPVIGPIFRRTAIARFGRVLGTLLHSGVSILDALDITRKAVGNLHIGEGIARARIQVQEGRRLAEPLRGMREFPPMVVDMIAIGEETGNLDEVLVKVADNYDKQVDRSVKVMVSLMEPAMLVVMGGVVGAIVIAMLLPVFTLQSLVN
jgi:type II secretion system protein F